MNLQEVLTAERELLQFASAFRSAKDLADAIGVAKSIVGGIDEYKKQLEGLKAQVEGSKRYLAEVTREVAEAQRQASNAKAELERAKEELASLASKLFGGR